jgi:Bacterial Ig-like domain (group 3)
VPFSAGTTAFPIAAADLNGGGAFDLLSVQQNGTLVILPNTGGTRVTFNEAPNPSGFQQTVALSSTVVSTAPGASAPTGSVQFADGAISLGSVALSVSGAAGLSTSALAIGAHVTSATYSGDATFYAHKSSVISQVVNKASTTTTTSSSGNPEVVGDTVTFSISVKPQFTGVPTGAVSLLDGATSIGSSALDAAGNANINISNFTAGSHSITASYPGDANFTASTSPIANQSILASPDFTAAPPASSPTVAVGQSANTTVTLTPIGNFTAPVTLACSGLPSLAQCSFNQSTYTLNRNVVTPVITISTVKGVAIVPPLNKFNFRSPRQLPLTAASELLLIASLLFGSLASVVFARGNRKLRIRGAAFCTILLGISLISSCGASTPPPPSTPVGTTSITITATAAGTSGTVTHQATISLTVTP